MRAGVGFAWPYPPILAREAGLQSEAPGQSPGLLHFYRIYWIWKNQINIYQSIMIKFDEVDSKQVSLGFANKKLQFKSCWIEKNCLFKKESHSRW